MIFKNLEWLALLPVLVLAGWYWPRLQLWKPQRVVLLLLITLILMRPQMRLLQDGMDLYVLLDRSASTEGKIDQGLAEWTKLLEAGKRSRHDRLIFMNYAADLLPQETLGNQPFSGNRNLTRTAQAIQSTLALRESERPSRMLVFTDGYSTEPLTGLVDKLLNENVPLDVRLLSEVQGQDFRVSRLDLPSRSLVSEPFLVEVEVTGPLDGPLPLAILRDGEILKDSTVELHKGRGVARFSDRIAAAGAHKYEAVIKPAQDGHAGNNRFEAWTELVGGHRVLLVTSYQDDPAAQVLQRQGIKVEVASNSKNLQSGQLVGCRAVILNNVPAHEIPADFLAGMPFFVREQGGGVLMAGGKKSFGSGGYFHSAVDAILPVSMEMKSDQRKLQVSMAIVMDRSGSMGAIVGGGLKKMDLANEGAAKAIEMLGYLDQIAVFAVDSEAHEAFGFQQVGDEGNKQTLMSACRRIQVGGGGIFTYTGLVAGWKVLKASASGTRHLILFADAADAEEPGDYKALVAEMVAEGATLSVIALGTPTDPDADFLKDVADRGRGRIFFTNQAAELPMIFTQETVAVARAAFIGDPVAAVPSGGWHEISSKDMPWLKEVDGFNLSYKREWASQALITNDEYAAPLVAWGQRGLGRSAAVSFPLGGEFSERIRSWEKYGDFLQTLGRWLMGEDMPAGLGLRYDLSGTTLNVDLIFEPEWEETFANQAPRILLAEGIRAESQRDLIWRRLAPGHYSVSTDLVEGQMVRGVIQAGKHALPFGPVVVGNSAEWAFDPARVEELRLASRLSGGRELVELKDAWKSPQIQQMADLRHWLLVALMVLVLAEALITRMGWTLPEFAMPRRAQVARLPRRVKTQPPALSPATSPSPTVSANAPAVESAVPGPTEADQRRSRFARAKGNRD